MKFKCIIVDDDPTQRDLLTLYLKQNPNALVCGTFGSATEALAFMAENPPDILFLDIEMPDLSGIELTENLEIDPAIIFITGHAQYSIKGFELNVVDYLLKPISPERLMIAFNRACLRLGAKPPAENMPLHNKQNEFVFVKSELKQVKLNIHDIMYIDAVSGLLKIHTTQGIVFSWESIKQIEETLPDNLFIRIHKKFLVNLNHVNYVTVDSLQIDNISLPISRLHKKNVFEMIDKHSINKNKKNGG